MLVRNSVAALNLSGTSYCRNISPINIPALGTAITMSIWVKIPSYSGTQFIFGIANSGAAATTNFEIRSGVLRVEKGAGALLVGITRQPVIGEYTHLVYTSDGTTNSTYVNGILDTTSATAAGTGATTAVYVSTYNGASESFTGLVDEARIFNRALTAAEVLALYNTGNAPTGQVLAWLMNEGAGTSVTDSSGTGNTGTVSSATFTADTPSKARQLVNGNLVKNGDFEYAPPFTAATTGNAYINGTSSGSATNTLFGWYAQSTAGTNKSAQFDTSVFRSGTKSMKYSATNAADSGYIYSQNPNSRVASLAYPCLPNTSYTLTGWIKTTNASGTRIFLNECDGNDSYIKTNNSSLVTGTQDWTQVSVVATTGATTRYLEVGLQFSAGTIQDSWFDDITLTPTTPTARLEA